MTTFATRFTDGIRAFALLTGDIDKDQEKAKIRDGYAALLEWTASGVTLTDIATKIGRSKNQLTRDNTAAETLARFPKGDAVVIVKACNALTKTEAEKCTSMKALAEAFRAKSGETVKRRKPGGSTDVTDKGGKSGKGPKNVKGEMAPITPQALVQLMQSGKLLPANGWDANGYDLVAREASIIRDALTKAAKSVAQTA